MRRSLCGQCSASACFLLLCRPRSRGRTGGVRGAGRALMRRWARAAGRRRSSTASRCRWGAAGALPPARLYAVARVWVLSSQCPCWLKCRLHEGQVSALAGNMLCQPRPGLDASCSMCAIILTGAPSPCFCTGCGGAAGGAALAPPQCLMHPPTCTSPGCHRRACKGEGADHTVLPCGGNIGCCTLCSTTKPGASTSLGPAPDPLYHVTCPALCRPPNDHTKPRSMTS